MCPPFLVEYLKNILDYDLQSGEFIWKVRLSIRIEIGQKAGYKTKRGYIYIGIDNKIYKAHQLAWYYVTGEWKKIDHRNQVKCDNRFENLRPATKSQNGANRGKTKNNKSGIKGVSWHQQSQKWESSIMKDGKRYRKFFDSKEEAAEFYRQTAIELYGEFSCW